MTKELFEAGLKVRREVLGAGLVQQVTAQGLVADGRPELQDIGEIVAGEHGGAGGAKLVEREKLARRAGHGETDDVAAEPGMADERGFVTFQEGGPINGAPGCRGLAGYEASAADLAGDQAAGLEQLVGGGNGGPVQSKQASQFAGGWKAFAAGQLA